MPDIRLTQKQIAEALVQHYGRLGEIPQGWLAEVSFDNAVTATISAKPQPIKPGKHAGKGA